MPAPTNKPGYCEALILMAIDPRGTAVVDIAAALRDAIQHNIATHIERLRKKGLVENKGTVRRYRARASTILVLTKRGQRVRAQLDSLSGWPHVRMSAFQKLIRNMPEPE